MNAVLRAGLTLLGIVGLAVGATAAFAQEEAGDDFVTKKDNTKQGGKIKSEDVKGLLLSIGKADITLDWKTVKSVDYAGQQAQELKQAKGMLESGSTAEAVGKLEELRKKEQLRPLLKPHVLKYLGDGYYRLGEMPKAIEVLNDLFAKYPKTQFLVKGGGETLVNAFLANKQSAEAQTAMDAMLRAGADPASMALLKGRVLEASGDFAGAGASYKSVLDGGADADTKAGAELGVGRCLLGQKKTGDADAKFQALCSKAETPKLVLAGAWNGRGDIWYQAGAGKNDPDVITDALFAYLRSCVLYVPESGESTAELERGLRGAHDCFKALGEMEKDKDRKRVLMGRARDRLELLRTKFPGSPSLNGIK